MSDYPFVTAYTCGSFPSEGTRMPSATLSTRTPRFFSNQQGVMEKLRPDVLYHVQAVEVRGPEGTFVHLVLEDPERKAAVVEVPIEELHIWTNVFLN